MRSGCHTEIATGFSSPRNGEPKITRLPRAFGSRNDDSCFCHCEQSEAIYKPHSSPRHIIASEAKQSTTIICSPFCHCEEQCDEAIHNHHLLSLLSLRGVKRRSNPQTTYNKYKIKKSINQ